MSAAREVGGSLLLYRKLQRQVSALHDDVARNYLSRFIRKRFEQHREDTEEQRLRHLLKLGWKRHNILLRANMGAKKPLLKVLDYAYGRLGERRRRFLYPAVAYPTPPNEPIIPSRPETAPPVVSPPLRALLKLQRLKLEPTIPAENKWGRDFPLVRENNLRKKHHAAILKEVQAPLPARMHRRLVRFAKGSETPTPPKWKKSMNTFENVEWLRSIGQKPQVLKLRSWRRLYENILSRTPLLDWDERTGQWIASYVSLPHGLLGNKAPAEAFDGVTATGLIPGSIRDKTEKSLLRKSNTAEGTGRTEGLEEEVDLPDSVIKRVLNGGATGELAAEAEDDDEDEDDS